MAGPRAHPGGDAMLQSLHSHLHVDFPRTQPEIFKQMARWSVWAAVFGCLGLCSVLVQNELVIIGTSPTSAGMTCLKLLNTVATLGCLAIVFHIHWYAVLSSRLDKHTKTGESYTEEGAAGEILRSLYFWGEVVVCAPHLPPGCTFEMGVEVMGNFVLYRGETIDLVVSSLRLYLIARAVWHWGLSDMPKRHSVAFWTHARIGPLFALKRVLTGWQAIVFISMLWLAVILVFGYLFRLSEATACKFEHAEHSSCSQSNAVLWSIDSGASTFEKYNDMYFSNAVWTMFITSTTVGYGDNYAVTHLGRVVTVITALCGILLTSLLTAALGSMLEFTSPEYAAKKSLEGAKKKVELRDLAAIVLARWARDLPRRREAQRGQAEGGAGAAGRGEVPATQQRLRQAIQAADKEKRRGAEAEELSSLEGCASMHDKVCFMAKQVGEMEDTTERLRKALAIGDEELPRTHERRHRNHRAHIQATGNASVTGLTGLMLSVNARSMRNLHPSAANGNNQNGNFNPNGNPNNTPKYDWRKSKTAVQENMVWLAHTLAGLAMGGFFCAMIQNELVLADRDPGGAAITVLKIINLILSLLCLPIIFRLHARGILLKRLIRALGVARVTGEGLDVGWKEVFGEAGFWAEVCICGIHLPPGATFESSTVQGPNTVVYRGETIFFLLNTVRIYTLFRVLKDWGLSRTAHAHSIAAIHRVRLGYRFVAKQALNSDYAAASILFSWLLSISLIALWVRASEFPACILSHSSHPDCELASANTWTLWGGEVSMDGFRDYHNAWWCMFITGTTVGYGDLYPVTHLGRLCGAISAIVGALAASLLTAALMARLVRSSEEECAYNVLLRERAIARMKPIAARMIQIAYRNFKREARKQSSLESIAKGGMAVVSLGRTGERTWEGQTTVRRLFEELRSCQLLAMQGPEDTESTEQRVEHTLSRLHKLADTLELCVTRSQLHSVNILHQPSVAAASYTRALPPNSALLPPADQPPAQPWNQLLASNPPSQPSSQRSPLDLPPRSGAAPAANLPPTIARPPPLPPNPLPPSDRFALVSDGFDLLSPDDIDARLEPRLPLHPDRLSPPDVALQRFVSSDLSRLPQPLPLAPAAIPSSQLLPDLRASPPPPPGVFHPSPTGSSGSIPSSAPPHPAAPQAATAPAGGFGIASLARVDEGGGERAADALPRSIKPSPPPITSGDSRESSVFGPLPPSATGPSFSSVSGTFSFDNSGSRDAHSLLPAAASVSGGSIAPRPFPEALVQANTPSPRLPPRPIPTVDDERDAPSQPSPLPSERTAAAKKDGGMMV